MPVIAEDDELGDAPDFSKLLDLPEAAFPSPNGGLLASAEANPPLQTTCPSHLESIDYLSNNFMGGWDLPLSNVDQELGLEEPDYAKFENWIPRFIRPEKPCDYCRLRRLNCYITHGETACTPCNALFRECSLTNTRTLEWPNQSTGHLLDTLHVVDEDAAKEQGTFTGIKRLQSKSRSNGRTTSPVGLDDAPGSSKRNGIRFPRHAVKILRDWLGAHENNPYPTENEKTELEEQTELKPTQIANWLANARRRQKVTDKAKSKQSRSPSLRATTPAIEIPVADKPWDELNPFERWKHSPPEHEPASFRDIANAAANSDLPGDSVSTSPSTASRKKKRSSNESCFSIVRAPSTTSFETGQSSSMSATNSIARSQQSSRSYGSFGSFSSGLTGKRDRRRRRRPTPLTSQKTGDDKKRNFQCTFCTDTFRSKYDWTRHEKSLHLSLEKWICAPLGPIITDPASGHKRCVFCDELDPSDDHLETHSLRQCDGKGLDARTFYRKDHLRQHLRLIHNCEMTTFMENWKSTAVNINSRCGFCAHRFTVWQERVDHLTAHFKAGARMAEWKGCRGLDPAVAAQVTNAMPPYLIGVESVSPDPFTASNKPSWRRSMERKNEDESHDILDPVEGVPESAKATCWEILTVRLGKYANEMAKGGAVLTDEMLQAEARRILYDSDDSWNQTAADNPEWLDLFKKAHGLDFIPEYIGGQGRQVPEDLETYGDLGLRIPFAVQLKAHNQQLRDEDQCNCGLVAAQHSKSIHDEKRAEQMRIMYRELAREGVLHDSSGRCAHSECDNNMMEVTTTLNQSSMASLRWCTYDLSPDKAERIARLAASSGDSEPTNAKDSRPQTPTAPAPFEANTSTNLKSTESSLNAPKKSFLQRYRYELPTERAQRFATTTGAWQDSGMMPEAVPTSTPDIDQRKLMTTRAMMEFFGGDVGQFVPIASDTPTSSIPLASNFGPNRPETSVQQAATIREIDRLIAENTQAQAQQSITAPAAEMDLPNDFMMDDLNFDYMDINFDGDFDMPMDEAFGMSASR